MDRDADCRDLLASVRPAWREGHGQRAWDLLGEATEAAADVVSAHPGSPLPVEIAAVRAGLALLAERTGEAITGARRALELAESMPPGAPRRHGPPDQGRPGDQRGQSDQQRLAHAVADARVTLATCGGEDLDATLAILDAVAHDPTLRGSVASARAQNNALLLRLESLRNALHTTAGQVQAWIWVSEAKALTTAGGEPGTVLRQAVDLAFTTGHWERGWEYARELITREGAPSVEPGHAGRNELVSVLAKAALLAWHRGMLPEARDLGSRARMGSVAVDHPWVRTYAYLGGVVEAAAGGGSLERALGAYSRCTSKAGHATRPHRAWSAAVVALDAGHSPAACGAFLVDTLPAGAMREESAARARALLADAAGTSPDPADLSLARTTEIGAPDRARLALAAARSLRRQHLLTASAHELQKAREALRNWPGMLLDRVEEEARQVQTPLRATPAQRRVLALVAEGLSNAEIARRLGCSPRTVAVHIAALLRANGLTSRTQLAVHETRARSLGVGFLGAPAP